ncbi:MAG: hypothetical protein ACOY45_03350 [Pseudomonadota bacterium]
MRRPTLAAAASLLLLPACNPLQSAEERERDRLAALCARLEQAQTQLNADWRAFKAAYPVTVSSFANCMTTATTDAGRRACETMACAVANTGSDGTTSCQDFTTRYTDLRDRRQALLDARALPANGHCGQTVPSELETI